jgi:hypothetical protein
MERAKLDHVLFGLLIAFVVAALGSFMVASIAEIYEARGVIDETTSSISGRRSRTSYLIGICLNIIPINYFKRLNWMEAQRGNVVGTFICSMIWIYFFRDAINLPF